MRRAQTSLSAGWIALAVALLGAAVACWWRARRSFFSAAEARVLLESHLRLDTRLTAAATGIGGWPAVPADLPAVVQWQLKSTLSWFGSATLLLIAAVW